jgi:hypothetical protein
MRGWEEEVSSSATEHKFNDDLLANDEDRKVIHNLYPTLEGVLYHPELVHAFKQYDDLANAAKAISRKWGRWAIVLAAVAISLAAAEIVADRKDVRWSLVIGAVAAVCGVTSVVVGAFGVLFGSRKREWLHNRFMGERIRQFHFQSLVGFLPEILALLSHDNDRVEQMREKFESERRKRFLKFQNEFDGNVDSKFTSLLGPQGEAECWVDNSSHSFLLSEYRSELEPFFAAYRDLRIKHQLDYANYKLQSDHKLLSGMPVRQAELLENVSKASIAWLFLIHITVLLIVLSVCGMAIAGSEFRSEAGSWISTVFSVAIIVIAVVALSARAFQQGLQPEREIERYQQYRSALQSILKEFDDSDMQNQKLMIMRQMERVSFDEMRNFLRTQDRSSFAV